jgi:hypothetical protein
VFATNQPVSEQRFGSSHGGASHVLVSQRQLVMAIIGDIAVGGNTEFRPICAPQSLSILMLESFDEVFW